MRECGFCRLPISQPLPRSPDSSPAIGRGEVTVLNIPLMKPDVPSLAEIDSDLHRAFSSTRLSTFSHYVQAFERAASSYLNATAVTVPSCTTGLILALQACGLRPGQAVIAPSFTFMATAHAILYAGGVPVFADVDHTLTLSPAHIEYLLHRHEDVGAVLPVHAFGLPCDVKAIEAVVARFRHKIGRQIPIVYDAAHAFGASRDGKRVGGFGEAEVFSLSMTKPLTSIEGGIVSSNTPAVVERLRLMRNFGMVGDYNAVAPGMNGKMSELHAIIGLHNLHRMDERIRQRLEKARYYRESIKRLTLLETSPWTGGAVHTFKDFVVLLPKPHAMLRDEVRTSLMKRGIETRAYFSPPVHRQDFFRRFSMESLPYTDDVASRVIILPFFTTISAAQMDYVVDNLVQVQCELGIG
jgi:dTDP-4-amino-4,6-dideoxygalactose transaminase